MHLLQIGVNYRMVAIVLAVPDTIKNAELADGLNEMLRNAEVAGDCVFDDYMIQQVTNVPEQPIFTTIPSTIEEGDAFVNLPKTLVIENLPD